MAEDHLKHPFVALDWNLSRWCAMGELDCDALRPSLLSEAPNDVSDERLEAEAFGLLGEEARLEEFEVEQVCNAAHPQLRLQPHIYAVGF